MVRQYAGLNRNNVVTGVLLVKKAWLGRSSWGFKRIYAWMLGVWLLGVMAGCESEPPWQISVEVRDHRGQPLVGAEVRLSGVLLGVSDERGYFEASQELTPGDRRRLEVFFETQSYHYAPYLKTFLVPELATGETEPSAHEAKEPSAHEAKEPSARGSKNPSAAGAKKSTEKGSSPQRHLEFEAVLYAMAKSQVVSENSVDAGPVPVPDHRMTRDGPAPANPASTIIEQMVARSPQPGEARSPQPGEARRSPQPEEEKTPPFGVSEDFGGGAAGGDSNLRVGATATGATATVDNGASVMTAPTTSSGEAIPALREAADSVPSPAMAAQDYLQQSRGTQDSTADPAVVERSVNNQQPDQRSLEDASHRESHREIIAFDSEEAPETTPEKFFANGLSAASIVSAEEDSSEATQEPAVPAQSSAQESIKSKTSEPTEPTQRLGRSSKPSGETVAADESRRGWVVETIAVSGTGQNQQPRVPLSGVEILIADEHTVHRWCVTSSKGFCVRDVAEGVAGKILFIARLKGYQTASREVTLSRRGRVLIKLEKGQSLDIFAFRPGFFTLMGWPGARVTWLEGPKYLGETSSAGFLSVPYPHPHKLPRDGGLDNPTDTFEGQSDKKQSSSSVLTASKARGAMTLEFSSPRGLLATQRIFVSGEEREPVVALLEETAPPKLRILLLRPQYQPRGPGDQPTPELMSMVSAPAKHFLFRHPMVHRVGWRYASESSPAYSLSQLSERGWRSQRLGLLADAMVSLHVYPPLAPGVGTPGGRGTKPRTYLQAHLILPRGQVHYASAVALKESGSLERSPEVGSEVMSQAVSEVIQKLRRGFPYQGSITSVEELPATVKAPARVAIQTNLGGSHQLSIGDKIEVRPLRAMWSKPRFVTELPGGRRSLVLSEVASGSSRAVVEPAPKDLPLRVADKVIYWGLGGLSSSGPDTIRADDRVPQVVVQDEYRRALTGVTAFTLGDDPQWLGVSDRRGRLRFRVGAEIAGVSLIPGTPVALRKMGYEIYNASWGELMDQTQPVVLRRLYTPVHVSTEPRGQQLWLQGKQVGLTPITYMMPVSSPLRLEIKSPDGRMGLSRTIRPGPPGSGREDIDFTGPRTFKLGWDAMAVLKKNLLEVEAKLSEAPSGSGAAASYAFQKGTLHFEIAKLWGRRRQRNLSASEYAQAEKEFRGLLAGAREPGPSASIQEGPGSNALAQRLIKARYYAALSLHRRSLIEDDRSSLREASQMWEDYLKKTTAKAGWPQGLSETRYLTSARNYARQARESLRSNQVEAQ